MKKYSLLVLTVLIAIMVSACGGSPTAGDGTSVSGKPRAALVEFTGVIDAIDGNQWTINGQVITVDSTVLHDGPYQVGDTVKVEAEVQSDGTVVVTRVEAPSDDDDDNGNDDDNSNDDDNGNDDDNSNDDDNGNDDDNSNDDDNGNDDDSNDNDDDGSDDDDDDGDDDDGSDDDDDDSDDDDDDGDDD